MNVGIVGFGYWGQNLVRNLKNTKDCNVTHIAESEIKKHEQIHELYPDIEIEPFDVIIKNSKIDAIVIATSVSSHYELAKAALENNKHVLIEKPIAYSEKNAEELIKLSKLKNKTLMVDHTYLYSGAVQEIKKLLDADLLGKILYIDSIRANLGKFQSDVNVLWDLATHDISICLHLLKEIPLSVQAIGKSHTKSGMADIAYLTLYFKSNRMAHLNCSWISPVKIRHMLIGGTKRMIVFNDLESTEKVKVYDSGYEEKTIKSNKFLTDYRVGDVYVPKLEMTEGLSNLVSDFASAIKSKKIPISNNKLSLMTVKILESAEKSLNNNGRIIKL